MGKCPSRSPMRKISTAHALRFRELGALFENPFLSRSTSSSQPPKIFLSLARSLARRERRWTADEQRGLDSRLSSLSRPRRNAVFKLKQREPFSIPILESPQPQPAFRPLCHLQTDWILGRAIQICMIVWHG